MILSGMVHRSKRFGVCGKNLLALCLELQYPLVRFWRRRERRLRFAAAEGGTASSYWRGWSQPEYGKHDAKTDDGAGCHPVPESPARIARRKRKPVLRGLLRHLRTWQCGGYRAGAAAKLGLPLLSVPQ